MFQIFLLNGPLNFRKINELIQVSRYLKTDGPPMDHRRTEQRRKDHRRTDHRRTDGPWTRTINKHHIGKTRGPKISITLDHFISISSIWPGDSGLLNILPIYDSYYTFQDNHESDAVYKIKDHIMDVKKHT